MRAKLKTKAGNKCTCFAEETHLVLLKFMLRFLICLFFKVFEMSLCYWK